MGWVLIVPVSRIIIAERDENHWPLQALNTSTNLMNSSDNRPTMNWFLIFAQVPGPKCYTLSDPANIITFPFKAKLKRKMFKLWVEVCFSNLMNIPPSFPFWMIMCVQFEQVEAFVGLSLSGPLNLFSSTQFFCIYGYFSNNNLNFLSMKSSMQSKSR